jgi:hypothetical protein
MKAEEKADEKHLYREEICVDIWDKYVALYFLWFMWRSLSKMLFIDYFKSIGSSVWKILFWKDRLVMPLDIAMKNAQQQLTNVYDTYNFLFFYQLLHLATAFFDNFMKSYSQCIVPCDLFLLDCGSLLIIEFSILAIVHIIVYSGAIMILFCSRSC